MKNSSAKDDLANNTLGKMSGHLTRAEYLASLLDEKGQLSHWGLEREYGTHSAQQAIDSAYSDHIQQLMRISLRELWYEAEKVGSNTKRKDVLLASLCDAIESRGGKRLNDVQLSHLKSVLNALLELALQDGKKQGS
jgi:hypothetical protein